MLVTAMLLCSIPLQGFASDKIEEVKKELMQEGPGFFSGGGDTENGENLFTDRKVSQPSGDTEIPSETEGTETLPGETEGMEPSENPGETEIPGETETEEPEAEALALKNVKVTVIKEVYKQYNSDTNSYSVPVTWSVDYEFSNPDATDEEKKELLGKYGMELTVDLDDGTGSAENLITEQYSLNDSANDKFLTEFGSLVEVARSGYLSWKAAVYDSDHNKLSSDESRMQIKLPEDVDAVFKELEVDQSIQDKLVYGSGENGDDRHFTAPVSASVVFDLTSGPMAGMSYAETKRVLEKYRLVVEMFDGDDTELKPMDGSVSQIKLNLTEADYREKQVKFQLTTNFKINKSSKYHWKAVLKGPENRETKLASQLIEIPEEITLKVYDMEIKQGDLKAVFKKHSGSEPGYELKPECIGYNLPADVTARIKIEGADTGGVPASERLKEIENCLSGKKIGMDLFRIKEDGQKQEQDEKDDQKQETVLESFVDRLEDKEELAEQLAKALDSGVEYKNSREFYIDQHGSYILSAYYDPGTGDEADIEKAEDTVLVFAQNEEFSYANNKNSECYFGETVAYTQDKGHIVSDEDAVEYSEVDIDGNPVKTESLSIRRTGTGKFEVEPNKDGTFYVKAVYKGNKIYEEKSFIDQLVVKKAEIKGSIQIYNTTSGWWFWKKTKLNIDTTFQTDNMEAFKKYYNENKKDIYIKISMIPQDNPKEEHILLKSNNNDLNFSTKNKNAKLSFTADENDTKLLKNEGNYTIKVTVTHKEESDFPYVVKVNDYRNFIVKNMNPYIVVDGTDQDGGMEVEYGIDHELAVNVYENKSEKNPTRLPLSITITPEQTDAFTIDGSGKIHALKPGTAKVTIIVDDEDNDRQDYFNKAEKEIYITTIAPSNREYTINGRKPDEFYRNPDASVGSGASLEHWYKDDIIIRSAADSLYTDINYRKKNTKDWNSADAKQGWTIGESGITDYEFYFSVGDTGFRSTPDDEHNNTLLRVGVDKTAPDIGTLLAADRKAEGHSTKETSYFSSAVKLSAYAKGKPGNGSSIDSGAGISRVFVQYGNSAGWTELKGNQLPGRYAKDLSLTLAENKMYGTVKIKVADYMGKESETAVYNGSCLNNNTINPSQNASAAAICIDSVKPELKTVSFTIDEKGKKHGYDGEWTNDRIQHELKLDSVQTSGIYAYEYAFVPKGSKFSQKAAEWKSVSADDMKVVLGSLMKSREQGTSNGKFLYPDKKSGGAKTDADAKGYAQMNGTLYFRAESNAGLFSSDQNMSNTKQETKIWQEDLSAAKVYADKRADSDTGWYNRKTGKPNISFEYPAYQAAAYAPAVGVVYELQTKTMNDDTTVTKRFYKGIFDEKSGEIKEAADYNDPKTAASLEKDGTIKISRDSISKLTVYTEDAAGNRSDKKVYQVKADFSAPELLNVLVNDKEQKLHSDENENIIYRTFSSEKVRIQGNVDYGISNEKNLYMKKCRELKDREDLSKAKTGGTITMGPSSRGFIYLYAEDGAGNTAEAWTDGIVTDDEAPVGAEHMDISIKAHGANAADFFNKDFLVGVSVKDSPFSDNYSGLKSVTYSVGKDNADTKSDVPLYQFTVENPTWLDLVKSASYAADDLLVNAVDNESNEAYLSVTATDKAGNARTTKKIFQIDVTDPEIEVTFDKNLDGGNKYYNEDRTAQIRIHEKNFDPKLVNFIIKKDGAAADSLAPSPESWNAAGDDVYTCNLTFSEDGDYTLALNCTDLADNYAEFEETEEFTIDKTKPVVEVTYDNNSPNKENYYNSARTATITVEEHNFDEKRFEASVTPQAGISGWTSIGDTHRATVTFSGDEHYTFSVTCQDLAGNEMDPFTEEDFYIDTEAPEISITGVLDGSANAGDVVPVVSVRDTNFDADGVKITLTNSRGGEIALNRETSVSEGGHVYRLSNVNDQPDEIYTLHAAGTDLAGNESELNCSFSLNRHGSTYDLSGMTALVNKVYTRYNSMEDLHITETNVDEVEGFSIYISRNGELLTAGEGNVQPVSQDGNQIRYDVKSSGDPAMGYRYEYTIYKENFEQEGIYNIMFYSKDRAGNEVNNTLNEKDSEITFVVDNTAPNVVIDGIESGEFYAEDSKNVNVYVTDNFKLDRALFYLVDEDGNTVETYNYMELAEEGGDIVTLTLPNSDKKQSLIYQVSDAAENGISTSQSSGNVPAGFMITTNTWLKYINNKAAVAGTACAAGATTVTGAGSAALIRRRRFRRKKIK